MQTVLEMQNFMEEGGQSYVEKSQTEAFKAHLWRVPNQKVGYHY